MATATEAAEIYAKQRASFTRRSEAGSETNSIVTPHSEVSNPFATPAFATPASASPAGSVYGKGWISHKSSKSQILSTSSGELARHGPRGYFRSRRIRKGTVDRPELRERDRGEIWLTIIPWLGILLGLGIIGLLTWRGIASVENHTWCSVLYDDFSGGFNPRVWSQEVECGGFGNGEFEITTGDNSNVFVRDGQLIIKPTIQDEDLVNTDSVTNLTAAGTCTSNLASDCVIVSNVTGGYIINPVKSARINTKNSVSIKYGKVEVTAKMAAGDWLIPGIWMLPVNNTYGTFPRSGEIDIAMARGNNYTYVSGGNNIMSSTAHWGPEAGMDAWYRTNVNTTALHSTFTEGFHTFGLEWSEKYLFTYVDSRLMQAMYMDFKVPLWQQGDFPASDKEGKLVTNPWAGTGNSNTPFDQEFYLILNVAVGGTSGWFVDGKDGKPWVDSSDYAKRDFWAARDEWYPTWQADGAGEMVIDKVRMWKQCDGGS